MSTGTTPAASTSPSPMDPVERIKCKFRKWDNQTKNNQKKRLAFGFVTALLGPLAVLFLSLQILAFPNPEEMVYVLRISAEVHARGPAMVLILLELTFLLSTLIIGFCQIGRSHHNWIEFRVRTEILRRERFLLQARVGPYLTEPRP